MSLAYADGSAVADRPGPVVIDLEDELDRYRFRCPNRHTTWEPTNSHCWCASCATAAEHNPEIDPEHYELLDTKTDELVPWSAVELEG